MKLHAGLGFEVGGHMLLLNQFMVPMSEWTRVKEFASSRQLPILAHLSFELGLVLLHKVITIAVTRELLLGLLDRGHLYLSHGLLLISDHYSFLWFLLVWSNRNIIKFSIFIGLIKSNVGHKIHRANYLIRIQLFGVIVRWICTAANLRRSRCL